MSSLSAQLSALNSAATGGKNVGSSLSISRSHEDTIGRGIGHSAKHGHSLNAASPRFKPSVLYADAKEASDVPLTTLRENCVSSLRQIAKVTENDAFVEPQYIQTLAGVHSLNFERGLATRQENERVDGIIGTLLFLLSTVLGETASSSCFSSALHVLEYLLRRYDIHARPTTAERLLIAILPHHEQPLLSRVLQLVDLASLPTWAFLRPHAAKGAPTVSRMVLSKRASKDTVLLKHCCGLAQTASRIHAVECGATLMESPRRGVSRVVSFAAAIVVEALSVQSHSTGSIMEPSLRCLLPFILSACGDKNEGSSLACHCPDWRGFGYVVTSCVVERCVLAGNIRESIATALVKGALETFQVLENADQREDKSEETQSVGLVESVADALVVLMSVLQQGGDESASTLVAVPRHSRKGMRADDRIGLSLPAETYRNLLKLPCVAPCLGHLFEDRDLDISPLVASLFAHALSRLSKEDDARSLLLMLDLIQEPSLISLWQDDTLYLTAAASNAIVVLCAKETEGGNTMEDRRTVLEALRSVHSTGCDAGTAHAVTHIFGRKRSSSTKERVMSLLGISENLQDSSSQAKSTESVPVDGSSARLLPPMVALEHAEPSIRLDAIRRLTTNPGPVERSELVTAFLRHLATEEDRGVALAGGSALLDLLKTASTPMVDELISMTLASLKNWGLLGDLADQDGRGFSEDRLRILELCLDVAGHVGRIMTETKGHLYLLQDANSLIHSIVAHLELPKDLVDQQSSNAISRSVCTALCRCLGTHSEQGKKGSLVAPWKLLVSNEDLRRAHREEIRPDSTTLDGMCPSKFSRTVYRLKYLRVYLRALTAALEKSKSTMKHSDLEDLVLDAFETSLACVSCYHDGNVSTTDSEEFSLCHVLCAKRLPGMSCGRVPGFFVSLASIQKQAYFLRLGAPAISVYCDELPLGGVSVLLEAASRDGLSGTVVIRLLQMASDRLLPSAMTNNEAILKSVVVSIAFLGHTDKGVRISAVSLMKRFKDTMDLDESDGNAAAKELCCAVHSGDGVSSIRMGGNFVLPSVLSTCARKSNDPEELRRFVLNHCCTLAADMEEGGCRSVAILLHALETAGEAAWPLTQRWELAGKPILDMFMGVEIVNKNSEMLGAFADLLETVARMLKGVKVDEASSRPDDLSAVVISTGPNTMGTRARSYSVGGMQGVSFINPYPEEMCDTITGCMAYADFEHGRKPLTLQLCRCIIRDVICSRSWADCVFTHMKTTVRRMLASQLLSLREWVGNAGDALLGLPLNASDIAFLLSKQPPTEQSLASITFLTDYSRTHSERLTVDPGLSELFKGLFAILTTLSALDRRSSSTGLEEFVWRSALQALAELAKKTPSATGKTNKSVLLPKKELASCAEFLVRLLANTDSKAGNIRSFTSSKSTSAALALLTALCTLQPEAVVASLVPAVLGTAVGSHTGMPLNSARGALVTVLPVYERYAHMASLSMFDLFGPLIDKITGISSKETQRELCGYTVEALSGIAMSPGRNTDMVGCFMCAYLVKVAGDKSMRDLTAGEARLDGAGFATTILRHATVLTQVTSILQVVACAHVMILKLADEQRIGVARSTSMEFYMEDMERLMPRSERNRSDAMMTSTLNILQLIDMCLSDGPIRYFIRRGNEAELCLRLWQDLLVLQSTLLQGEAAGAGGHGFWDRSRNLASKSLAQAQGLLPTHLFVASTASLLRDSEDVDLQSRALRLIADKVSETDPKSPEASIVFDLVPLLLEVMESSPRDGNGVDLVLMLKQSALLAIETLARRLCLHEGQINEISRSPKGFFALLEAVTDLMREHSRLIIDSSTGPLDMSRQAISSAALCSSTLVRLLKVQTLPALPKLINSLLDTLVYVNKEVGECGTDDSASISQPELLQLSLLRALMALVESVPQFLSPYLDQILGASLLSSKVLRKGGNDSANAVTLMPHRIRGIISARIPARQLIPAACRASKTCSCAASDEKILLLSVVNASFSLSTQTELSTVKSWALDMISDAYDSGESDEKRLKLLDMGNQVLLAMVLKMSESQLRPLYVSLREWSRDESKAEAQLATRKRAFWSLSCVLSKELRMIFLPHFGEMAKDTVDDLNDAVSKICAPSSSFRLSQGKKRRRLGTDVSEASTMENLGHLTYLPFLLECLEHVFKADAHDGGSWIRADDGQRFTALLEPLTKLLHCRVPTDMPRLSTASINMSSTPYEWLVHGEDRQGGSVIACLTALATAAGNEQLWKPLNYGVLEACGNENRSEVRKAGVTCLLSLIQTLGEEYMVLLPECLPILSELLEDGDETIAGLSQECVSLGEELLGESLQESLR